MQADYDKHTKIQESYKHYRTKLLPFAYNIIGDMMSAEDVVQEVLNKYILSSSEHIKSERSYLIRSVINKAISFKQLLANRMYEYPGEWLPSPVFTEEKVYADIDKRYWLRYSLLILLEHLNAKERAVFILKESFAYSHAEIADLLGIEVEHSRQLLRRGKARIQLNTKVEDANLQGSQLEALTTAITDGDIEKVKSLLHEDVRSISDGGPKTSAARKILYGPDTTIKLLQAIHGKYLLENSKLSFAEVNHMPAVVYSQGSQIYRCIVIELAEERIKDIFIILNPDKLKNLNFTS